MNYVAILLIMVALFLIIGSFIKLEREVRFYDKYGMGIKIQRRTLLSKWQDTGEYVPLASRENNMANKSN